MEILWIVLHLVERHHKYTVNYMKSKNTAR